MVQATSIAQEAKGCDLVAWDVKPGSGALAELAHHLEPIETHAWRPGPELGRDLLRTARRLTGHSTGIVLSGGGARAFSHIGALEELLAAGLKIDRVAGVSMGAYIGAMFAAGMDVEGDRRPLLRGVGAPPSPGRLRAPAPCADPWAARRRVGTADLRLGGDRRVGAVVRLPRDGAAQR